MSISNTNIVNPVDIHKRIIEIFKTTGWYVPLRYFLESEEMLNIIKKLSQEVFEKERRFTPRIGVAFRAFQECKPENLKVVILGQSPYPKINVADGIAFSCSNSEEPEVSLRYMFQSIIDTVELYKDEKISSFYKDLRFWANQGVLLLNTTLTCTINKPETHYEIWKDFIIYVLDYIVWNYPDVIFVFFGSQAQTFEKLVPNNFLKLFAKHPASAAYNKEVWDCNDIWNKINKNLVENGIKPIIW